MTKAKELTRITRTLNNIYLSCQKAEDVHFDEIEVKNSWSQKPRRLIKQEIVIRFTLFGAKSERL